MTVSTQGSIHDVLVLPYLNHAIRMLESGYASAADIDNAMRFGCGYPQGPLATVDEIGASAVRDALLARFEETGDNLHKPAGLLTEIADGAGSFTAAAGDDVRPPQLRHTIEKIGVVGTGTMASGIVQVFAQAGYDVVFVGRSPEKVDGVVAGITRSLDKAIAKGRSDEETKAAVLGRLTGTTSRENLADADLVVEGIAEDLDIKTELFKDLDRITKAGAILATTTSSMPITELAKVTSRPGDVIGMHFFNPAPVMKLVEVVTTDLTSPEVDETVRALSAAVKKVPVSCGDRSGFIVNALLFPYLNDAVKLHEAGVAMDEIDATIKETAGFPMGPFELLDVVGNDVSLAIQSELRNEFGEPGFDPAALLIQKVQEGKLGRKTGEGFHTY
ncbi:3-hydroxyacyl-CoA dehydrogenase NAD-binding domain-containing protein [Nocardioides albus]|uniref:3-hydroxybutyryl-CoA dehydrogenase n=1 Tax=Nocardioides albus TaxID=1841 RepID=A0A7W5A2R8_9ACTN|nr:3-hydroxyacyl-CoA dehydrogenase NAD-binding domain-containing protein [Nocardioides albus]MBB3088461.1 3-hydroxybutyryl-CoA dehydrogenase [Nocardioides albus]